MENPRGLLGRGGSAPRIEVEMIDDTPEYPAEPVPEFVACPNCGKGYFNGKPEKCEACGETF